MLAGALVLGALAAIAGVLAARAPAPPAAARGLVERIDALLPQLQCRACGYDGCRPYAQALAAGRARINRCPPGGATTVRSLADLLGTEPLPLEDRPGPPPQALARIDEFVCIGCAKCLPACPVDAIVGARGQLHVVVERWCTGCGLCLPPCPVDCIRLQPRPGGAA